MRLLARPSILPREALQAGLFSRPRPSAVWRCPTVLPMDSMGGSDENGGTGGAMEIRFFTDKRGCSRCGRTDPVKGLLAVAEDLVCSRCIEKESL